MLVTPQVQTIDWMPWLLGFWLAGLIAILALRLLRWSRLRAVLAQARDEAVDAPVQVKTSPSLLEPGLVGILRPAVLLPAGLMARLSAAERDSILAHEFSHLSRRDNVTAALHMTVEALFWFYPPVWLIGARLIAERERACDENVLASGHDPEVYAGGILKVCKFCIQSPLACAPGVSGADLGLRVRQIMTAEAAQDIGAAKRLLLAGACVFTLAVAVSAGFLDTPLARQVTHDVMAVQVRAQQAVTALVEQVVPQTQVTVASLPKPKSKVTATPARLPEVAAVDPEPVPAPVTIPSEQLSAATAPAPVVHEPVTALNPMGDGDADAITCRLPQPLPGSRLRGPQVCKPNRVWAQLKAEGQDISEDGSTVVPRSRTVSNDCSKSALLGAFQSQTIAGITAFSNCR